MDIFHHSSQDRSVCDICLAKLAKWDALKPHTQPFQFHNHTALLLQKGNNLKGELETITKTHMP